MRSRAYHEAMTGLIRTAVSAPAATPAPPRRVWRDWALLGILVPLTLVEGILQWGTPGIPAWVFVTLAILPTLLWRRQRPFTMLAIAYVATEVVSLAAGRDVQLVSTGFILVLVYAAFRWGTGLARIGAVALILSLIHI